MPRTPSRSLAIPHPRTFLYSYLLLVPAACTHKVPSALHPYTRRTRTCHTQCSSSFSSGTVRLGCRGTPPSPVPVYSYCLQSTVPPILQPERCRQGFIHLLHSCIRLRSRRHLPRPLVLVCAAGRGPPGARSGLLEQRPFLDGQHLFWGGELLPGCAVEKRCGDTFCGMCQYGYGKEMLGIPMRSHYARTLTHTLTHTYY